MNSIGYGVVVSYPEFVYTCGSYLGVLKRYPTLPAWLDLEDAKALDKKFFPDEEFNYDDFKDVNGWLEDCSDLCDLLQEEVTDTLKKAFPTTPILDFYYEEEEERLENMRVFVGILLDSKKNDPETIVCLSELKTRVDKKTLKKVIHAIGFHEKCDVYRLR